VLISATGMLMHCPIFCISSFVSVAQLSLSRNDSFMPTKSFYSKMR
jgi:hypothetical protein